MSKLRDWRLAAGLSQAEFADKIGTSVPSVSRIEAGDQWPSPALMRAIEEVTIGEVTSADILATYKKSAKQAAE